MEMKEQYEYAKVTAEEYDAIVNQDSADLHPEYNGKRIKNSLNGHIFFVFEGKKCYIPDSATYSKLFRNWDGIILLSNSDCDNIITGPQFATGSSIIKNSAGTQYMLHNGQKCCIISMNVVKFCNFGSPVLTPDIVVNSIPSGCNITYGC